MALRARLAPPPPPTANEWPWHKPSWGTVPSSYLSQGDRRLEGEAYLSSGFGIRLAIRTKRGGWNKLSDIASVWMPGRLKGIQVSRDYGTPFLAATQVFDLRPTARKWLALSKTADAERRFVKPGQILVTCSGAVGRPTIAYEAHSDKLISHDILRVDPDPRDYGWIYAFMHTPEALAMNTGAGYGHIIKHLEESHLNDLPIPAIDDDTAKRFTSGVRNILALRNEAYRLSEEANKLFADAIGPVDSAAPRTGFSVSVSGMTGRRRRLEGSYYDPYARALFERFDRWEPLKDVADRVWWMPRFKRFYGEGGIPYLSADELFTVNPPGTKSILVSPNDSHEDYFVREGWIVMACSGQVYGLNGAAIMATMYHENRFFSHDLIRIIPRAEKVRSGYLLVAFTHPTHGRPLLIRAAYGTSIPHLDPNDVAEFPLVRLGDELEGRIADLAEAAAKARAEADAAERLLATEASVITRDFLGGKRPKKSQRDTQQLARHILDAVAPDA